MKFSQAFLKIALVISISAFAVAGLASNSGVSYQGRILKPDGTPLSGQFAQFKMQLRTPDSGSCLMYEEVQSQDLRNMNGAFSITINDGTGSRTDTTGLTLDKIFANHGSFTLDPATCNTGTGVYAPGAGDGRNLVVLFKDETMATWEPIPAQKINFVPFAFESKQIAGFTSQSLVRVAEADGTLDIVSPLSNANYTELLNLINGTTTQYSKAGQLGGVSLPTMSSGQVLGWNGTAWVSQDPVPASSVTSTQIASGAVGTTQIANNVSIATTGTVASAITTTRDFKIFAASPSTFAIDMQAPALTASYSLVWPLTAGSNNQVLTTDGSGNLFWGAGGGGGSSQWTTNGTMIGYTGGNVGIGTTSPAQALDVSGAVRATAVNVGDYVSEKMFTAQFSGGAANQKVQLYWPSGTRIQGLVEMTVTAGYEGAQASGFIKKRWGLHVSEIGSNYFQQVDSEALGATSGQFTMSDFIWDSTNTRWYVIVANRGTATNTFTVHIKTITDSIAAVNWTQAAASNVTMSSIYTTDATVYPAIANSFLNNVGIGTTAPTAKLALGAGTATAGTAPLKFTSGTLLTTAEDGAMEYNSSTGLYFTIGSTRYVIPTNSAAGNYSNVSTIGNSSGSITMTPMAGNSVIVNSTTVSTSPTTGALVVSGGVGISGDTNTTGNILAGGAVTATTNMVTPQLYGSTAASGNIKIDGTSNATVGNVLLATAGGKVGIGTTAPAYLMTASGAMTNLGGFVSTGANNAALYIDNAAGGNQSSLNLRDAGTTKWQIGKGTNNEFFIWDVANTRNIVQTSAGNLLLAPTAGNVGIGTTAPAAPLQVVGNILGSSILANNNAATSFVSTKGSSSDPYTYSYFLLGNTSNSKGYYFNYRDGTTIAGEAEQLQMTYYNGTTYTPRMTFDSSGNVGIGTTSPSDLLNVYQNQNAQGGLTVQNASTATSAQSRISASNSTNSATLGITSSTYVGTGLYTSNRGYVSAPALALAAPSGNMSFFTGGIAAANEHMTMDTSGNVGIGTTSPGATLDVNGAMRSAHVIAGGAVPTIVAGASAGTSPTVGVSGGDTAGLISLVTGSSTTANGTLATVTFATPYTTAPNCVFSAYSTMAAQHIARVYLTTTTTTMTLQASATALSASGFVYIWSYHCFQ